MALDAFLKLRGETQGEIKGSVTQAGREDSIRVIGVNHEVISPRDAASGLPTGKRQHKPLIITKEVDRASPLLMNALVNNEKITEFELRFWQPSRTGQEFQFYTIRLVDANIAGIRVHLFLGAKSDTTFAKAQISVFQRYLEHPKQLKNQLLGRSAPNNKYTLVYNLKCSIISIRRICNTKNANT